MSTLEIGHGTSDGQALHCALNEVTVRGGTWTADNEGLVLRGGPRMLVFLTAVLVDEDAWDLAAELAERVRPYGADHRLHGVYLTD